MLSDADRRAIEQTHKRLATWFAELQKDWSAVASFYDEDVTIMAPNVPAVRGHQQTLEFFKLFPPMPDFKAKTLELDGSGDLAYNRDEYSVTMTPPGLPSVRDEGKSVSIWRKQPDGSWKILRDIWNSDLPQPAA